MINPYQSPQIGPEHVELKLQRELYFPPHFTHIRVSGCNLLGFLNLVPIVGVVIFSSYYLSDYGAIAIAVCVVSVIGSAVFDFFIRVSSGEGKLSWRLASPSAGGCMWFIPMWAFYPMFCIGGVVCIIARAKKWM